VSRTPRRSEADPKQQEKTTTNGNSEKKAFEHGRVAERQEVERSRSQSDDLTDLRPCRKAK
jgi:hypothetical protein